jgi:hypothetical protein
MFRTFRVFFDTEGGGSSTTDGGSPAPTPAPAVAPVVPATGVAPPTGVPAPSSPGPEQFSYGEDRSAYLSPDRVNELIRERVNRVGADRDRYRAMLEAGTDVKIGVAPEQLSPEETEAQGVLMKLLGVTKEQLAFLKENQEGLGKMLKRQPELESSQNTQWNAHGARALNDLNKAVATAYGVEKLTKFQATNIGNSYANWIQSDGNLQQRYSWGDPSLTSEFVTMWQQGFIDPSRRAAQAPVAATVAGNAGLPAAPAASGVVPGGAPAKPKTEDEVLDSGWQAMVARQKAASAL